MLNRWLHKCLCAEAVDNECEASSLSGHSISDAFWSLCCSLRLQLEREKLNRKRGFDGAFCAAVDVRASDHAAGIGLPWSPISRKYLFIHGGSI